MRGIISITHRLRSQAEFLHSVEMSRIYEWGRSCCRIFYDGRDHVLFCAVSGIQAVLGTTQVFGCTKPQRASGSDIVKYPTAHGHAAGTGESGTLLAGAGPLSTPQHPNGAYGARTYAAPSNVNTDTDQFSIRIRSESWRKRTNCLGRYQYDNLTGPTKNPDQTLLDPSFGGSNVDRNTVTLTRAPRHRAFSGSTSLSFTRTTPSL